MAIIIGISPYIFYLYESLPDTKVWETSYFSFESNYQENVRLVGWLFMQKAIPLLFLILWFFTSRDWWYHIILIPIAMYTFQIVSVIKQENNLDETEIYYVIPVMMIIIPTVYFIRIKLFDKYVYNIDLKKIDAELAEYERKEKEQQKEENK
ncbi:hypothetical protein [Kordia zhangzhouensis]|uniref:hypothetical protein n=1 Tax=Kordia zhangzhouensis TaxID=1620405 RepID=UPI000AC433D6|nr:hypothetical protein [Kordia zhangzhouensis]